MAVADQPRVRGLERAIASVAHSAPWWGFPFVLPGIAWLVALLTRRSPYVERQSLQALLFQAMVTGALVVLAVIAVPFGLFEVLVYLFGELMRLFGVIVAGGFASIAMLGGEFGPMNEVGRLAHPAPFPGNHLALGILAVLAAAILLWAIALTGVATVQSLRGRPFHYPWLDRL